MRRNKRKLIVTVEKPRKASNQSHNTKETLTTFYLAAAIALLTLVVYLPSLKNGFIANWDDNPYVVENTFVHSLDWKLLRWAFTDTYTAAYWHPLTWISHAIDYALWGLNPAGHHLTSAIFHASNSGVVVLLTFKLLQVISDGRKAAAECFIFSRHALLIAAGVTGLLFGLHPLKVESVAWVAQRKDLLYSLFYLLSITSYVTYARQQETTGYQQPFYSSRSYYTVLILFFFSLCSKPMAITLPAVLLLLDWYPLRKASFYKKLPMLLAEKLPFLILSGAISIVSFTSQKSGGGLFSLEDAPFPVRILVAARGIMLYFWNMIAPVNLLPFYYYPKDVSLAKPEYLAAVLLITIVICGCFSTVKKQPAWQTAWLFFVVTLFPVLGIFQAGSQSMADRYTYIPSLAPFMLIGSGVAWSWSKSSGVLPNAKWLHCFTAAIVISITIGLSYLTIKQLEVWQSSTTFWGALITTYSKEINSHPNDESFYIKRGKLFYNEKKYDLAMRDFNTAIELKPDSAETFAHRGNVYLKTDNIEQAITEYDKAIEIKKEEYIAYINRGIAYELKGDIDRAIKDYSTGISIKPGQATLYIGRGDLYMKTGLVNLAIIDYQKACDIGNQFGCSKAFFPFDKTLIEHK